jgi:hypothetical protein
MTPEKCENCGHDWHGLECNEHFRTADGYFPSLRKCVCPPQWKAESSGNTNS